MPVTYTGGFVTALL